ncbi:hypothetical protein ILYODFUR_011892 [Ilyodon furcidens]|uniref:Uncharacterized protein n=1 Tax=Ilyodon furcidens TaxID=33524 RepID=A0ABV0VFQ6_9TELE
MDVSVCRKHWTETRTLQLQRCPMTSQQSDRALPNEVRACLDKAGDAQKTQWNKPLAPTPLCLLYLPRSISVLTAIRVMKSFLNVYWCSEGNFSLISPRLSS